MCRTRDRTADSTRDQTTRVRTAFRVRDSDKIYRTASSAEYRTSLSARITKRHVSVVGTNKDLALLRVRGGGQHNTMREVTLDEEI